MYALRLLGSPQLQTPSGTVKLERRPAAVAAYLTLEGSTPKYRLAGMLWPDSGETAARSNMRQLLRRMRVGGADIIEGEDFIGLREAVKSDVAQLSALDLGKVLELGEAGELLQGHDYDDAPDFDEWLLSVREELRDLYLRATDTEAQRLEQQGEYGKALELTQTALRLEPLSEETHRRLMRLHYLLGDRAAALAAFERCKKILADELGAGPLPKTLKLAKEIEQGANLPKATPLQPAVPLAMLRPPSLVGRERELAMMEEAWQKGQLIFVSGPAGSGKSRLIEDFALSKGPMLRIEGRPGDAKVPNSSIGRNQRRVLALHPGLSPTSGELEAWVWQEAARINPELGQAPPMASEQDKLRFYEGLMQLYTHCTRGLTVMVVDDLQFYDEASMEMATYSLSKSFPLGQGMPHHVVAFRRDEAPKRVLESVELLVQHGIGVHIKLEPLPPEAVGQLLDSLELPSDELAPSLSRYTGGNPLFVLETVRHLHQTGQLERGWPGRLPLAGKVKELTERRLQKLSKPALNLAQAAAVLKSDFTFEMVCEVVGHSPFEMAEAWQELEAAQIMSGERFSHDLLFEAVQQSMPEAVRGWLNRSAATALERNHANPARIAQHWLEGNQALKAAPWLSQAAQGAKNSYDLHKAADFYLQAAQIYQQHVQQELAFACYLDRVGVLFEAEGEAQLDEAIEQLSKLAVGPKQKAQARYFIDKGGRG